MPALIDRGNYNTLCVVILLFVVTIKPSLACFGCCCGGCSKAPVSGPPPPSFGYGIPPAPLPVYAAPPPQYAPPRQIIQPQQPAYGKPQPIYKKPQSAGSVAYGVQQYDIGWISEQPNRGEIIQYAG
uniref:SH3 domain-containing protein n=1 Tax=Wuchereria bancrofti TaxID=6293 RepID=A0AAF5Q055_WUCBA